MHRNDPIVHFWGELMDSIVQPHKGYRGQMADKTATRENPIRKPKWVLTTKWYDCWYENDGSYHESFVQEHTQPHE